MARLRERLINAAEGSVLRAEALLRDANERFAHIPISCIEPDPDQPRKTIGNLDELKASIREHGIVQPIVVSPYGDEKFCIVAGERRFTAARELDLKTVPAIIRTVEEHRRLEVQLIENIHRQELSPVEEATAYHRLLSEFQLSQRQLATRLGKPVSSINESLRILSLPEPILDSVRTSEHLTRAVLLEIAKQDDDEVRDVLWQRALDGSLTVKTARERKANPESKAPLNPRTTIPFKTKHGTVTVVIAQESVTPAEVVSALSQALKEAKLAVKPSAPDAPIASSETP